MFKFLNGDLVLEFIQNDQYYLEWLEGQTKPSRIKFYKAEDYELYM